MNYVRNKRVSDYIAALKQCCRTGNLESGITIHQNIKEHGLEGDLYLQNTLIETYAKCRAIHLARAVFEEMTSRNVVTWSCLMLGYVASGNALTAYSLFTSMDCQPNHVSYVAALKACSVIASTRDSDKELVLEKGMAVHQQLKKHGFERNLVVATTLVDMYCKCGKVSLAREVFNGMSHKTVVTWTCLMLGYVDNGECVTALELYECMGCEANHVTYIAALKACAGLASQHSEKQSVLDKGTTIHKRLRDSGLHSHLTVSNALIDMYGKCGAMRLAQQVFNETTRRDAVTWNSLMLGYVLNGQHLAALELQDTMDCEPNSVTFVAALKACTGLIGSGTFEKKSVVLKGMKIHEQLKLCGWDTSPSLSCSLIDMYSKCGSMNLAREVFDNVPCKDVVTWTCLMLGYVENSNYQRALELFDSLDCEPNHVTYVAVLKACSGLASENRGEKEQVVTRGMRIHEQLESHGFSSNVAVSTTLVDMYSKCGRMNLAREVFERMKRKSVVSWTCLILGYVDNGDYWMALHLFESMDCEKDHVTYVAAVKACTGLACDSVKQSVLQRGKAIHEEIREHGFDSIVSVSNTLLDMYSKLGKMSLAQGIFDGMTKKNVVSWTCLILGYVDNGQSQTALSIFETMDCQGDHVTYVGALKACIGLVSKSDLEKRRALETGIAIHEQMKPLGLDLNIAVSNTLIDMYSKCGDISLAAEVFNNSCKDVVTWNCIIHGHIENGESSRALELFDGMDCQPNSVTYVGALKACACLSDVSHGRRIHATVCKLGLEIDPVIATTLVDFYGSCGCMSEMEEIFNGMNTRNIVSWNSLLTGYSSLGDPSLAFNLLDNIKIAGLQPDAVSYLCVLSACSHAGMVEKGESYFKAMLTQGITPNVRHYACMVNMLGRANRLEEAVSVVNNMPVKANQVTWMSLLDACKKWNNLEVGKVAFEALVSGSDAARLSSAPYVVMSDLYDRLSLQRAGRKDSMQETNFAKAVR